MRSPQLTLCAAVAACAVSTAPAYAADARGTPATRAAAPAAAAAGPAPAAARSLAPPGARTAPRLAPHRPATRHELSSTSAVGLVLAGGAVLVIAGQLLRLRLRLRRQRQGSGGADES
ncbi:hypothetical protein MUU72_33465 [Streptomyces sp. RS10V-4]|uniref:hypothetical protein n=1 Tax=Streptomyces rhizoryzae TaxID=2932493 RepID=UPI002002D191|nr:hypothetical protein [Streptomyces rhizoryzae]MCK7627941.1 hypothetical protein [Streptomyces rhizoryzae]